MMKFLKIISFSIIFPFCVNAQEVAPSKSPVDMAATEVQGYDTLTNEFLDCVKKGKFKDASEKLSETNPIWQERGFGDATFKSLMTLRQDCGELEDFDPIVTKPVGKSVMYIYGIADYEKLPVRFEFMFYKTKGKWIILNFNYIVNPINEIRAIANSQAASIIDVETK